MKAKFAFFCVFLLCTAILFSSCGGPTLEEIRPIAEALITDSLELNEIFFGYGLPTVEGITGTDYRYVDLEKSRYDTIDQLKEAARAVYTADYCEGIFETLFVGITDSVGVILPRFTEDDLGQLMQDRYIQSILPGERTYSFDTMTIEKSGRKRVVIRSETETNGEKDEDAVLTLRFDGEKWLLDTPTY